MNKGIFFGLINTLKCVIPDQTLSEAIWLRGYREPRTLFHLKRIFKNSKTIDSPPRYSCSPQICKIPLNVQATKEIKQFSLKTTKFPD